MVRCAHSWCNLMLNICLLNLKKKTTNKQPVAQFFKSDNLLAIGWRHRDLTGYKKLYSDTLCKEYKLKNVIINTRDGRYM